MKTSLHHTLHELLLRFQFTASTDRPDFFRREASDNQRPYIATTSGRRQLLLTQGPRVVLQADSVTPAALEQVLTRELGEPLIAQQEDTEVSS
jgi:hypothetical protein